MIEKDKQSFVENEYNTLLGVIETLMDLDLPADSPEGRLFAALTDVLERYELEKFPEFAILDEQKDNPASVMAAIPT